MFERRSAPTILGTISVAVLLGLVSCQSYPSGRPDSKGKSLASEGPPAQVENSARADPHSNPEKSTVQAKPNLPLPTLGGRQLWADVRWFADWRIQQHVWTEHYRLLDHRDVRMAWGSLEACQAELADARANRGLQLRSDHLVILLHGLGRSRSSMSALHDALREAGYEVADVGYPSTRRSIAEHAEQIRLLLEQLAEDGGIEKVSFITHSLGGMVARAALALDGDWQQKIEVHRLLMLAPPSGGSAIAESLKDFLPFQWLTGESGQELALSEAHRIAKPNCRFAIVAAHRADGKGWNPGLKGADDGIVRVDEAWLEGSEDFWLVEGLHSFIMAKAEVIEASLRYLESGHLHPTD